MMIDRENEFFKTDEVKQAVTGKWVMVLSHFPALSEALKKPGRHVACPKTGQGKDGFRLFPKDLNERGGAIHNDPHVGALVDGFSLIMWLNDWDFRTAITEVAMILGMEPHKRHSPRKMSGYARVVRHVDEAARARAKAVERKLSRQQQLSSEQHLSRIQAIWNETLPLSDPQAAVARAYLANRGLNTCDALLNQLAVGNSLRFHQRLPYYGAIERKEVTATGEVYMREHVAILGYYPALIAVIRDAQGKPSTLHRTYLSEQGTKAEVDSPRKMVALPATHTVTGGAIRLAEPRGILGLAEGLETAAAAYQATRLPTWSCVSATLLAGFEPPGGVHTIVVWADRDRSRAGEEAARQLKARMQDRGIRVAIMLPNAIIPAGNKGVDWNDMLQQHGAESFPTRHSLLDSIANAS